MAKGPKVQTKDYDFYDADIFSKHMDIYNLLAYDQIAKLCERQEKSLANDMRKNENLTRELKKLKPSNLELIKTHGGLMKNYEKFNLDFIKREKYHELLMRIIGLKVIL
jgi:predicted ATP-binding protein involved in virulence